MSSPSSGSSTCTSTPRYPLQSQKTKRSTSGLRGANCISASKPRPRSKTTSDTRPTLNDCSGEFIFAPSEVPIVVPGGPTLALCSAFGSWNRSEFLSHPQRRSDAVSEFHTSQDFPQENRNRRRKDHTTSPRISTRLDPNYPSWRLSPISPTTTIMTMTPDVDNSDEEEDRGVVYTANSSSSRQRHRGSSANLRTGKRKTGSSSSANVNNTSSDPAFLRTRRWVAESSIHDHSHHDSYPGDGLPRGLCSGCGQYRIGESEDDSEETDAIPTLRKSPRRRPQFTPPSSLPQFTPYLFEFARLLSIVPALFGTLYNLHSAYHPEYYKYNPSSVDYYLSALWAVLTGIQCLLMTTGLLTRWQAHYPPLSILIRLLGLQAICWPATHFTLTILNHIKRPLACWAVIGTFTSFSRSVQIWVTSNLDYSDPYYLHDSHELHLHSPMVSSPGVLGPKDAEEYNGGRRLDWSEIGLKCAFPVGVMYFVTTWGVILKAEWGAC